MIVKFSSFLPKTSEEENPVIIFAPLFYKIMEPFSSKMTNPK